VIVEGLLRCDGCGAEDRRTVPRRGFPSGWQLTEDGHRCRRCMRLAGESAPVYATRAAVDEAQRLLPGLVLENEVRAAVAASGVRLVGDGKAEVVGSGWRASLIRRESSLTPGRQVWMVLQVHPS
jgi:hypothetical protein